MPDKRNTKTLLDLISADWHAAGNRVPLTKAAIAKWHEENPVYGGGKWPLSTRFTSGSAVPVRGATKLDRATLAWRAAGRGAPVGAAFNEFVAGYVDEFDQAFYQ